MNQFNIGTITVAISLAFSAGAMAQSMSKDEYRAGKDRAFNALVGQVMKASRGKANPAQASELLRQRLAR